MNELFTALAWAGDLLALYAAYLITKRYRSSFAVFVLADLFLMGVQIEGRIWSQVVLFFCFTCINAWGWFKWK